MQQRLYISFICFLYFFISARFFDSSSTKQPFSHPRHPLSSMGLEWSQQPATRTPYSMMPPDYGRMNETCCGNNIRGGEEELLR
jgi:hypothetical protein